MKAVIVTPHFHPKVGGVEVYTLNVARQLKALGWKVVIVTTAKPHSGQVEMFEDMKLYHLVPSATLSNTPFGLQWRRELRRIFAIEQPDIINAHTPVPYLADIAQRASGSVPFVLTYHNDLDKDFLPYRLIVKLLHFTVIARTLRRSTGIIATSGYYVNSSPYLSKHRSKIYIVPPGVDRLVFNPNVVVDDVLASRYRGKRVILFVGSLKKSHQHKGLRILISAFALIHKEFPDTKLVVVGQGDWSDTYKSLASSAAVGEHIEFTGYVNDRDLAQYYKLATVFAMPSTLRSEGFGMVYLEANAVGLPVVGSRIGGVPYAVKENETGLLVEPKSIGSLQTALRSLLRDSDLAERLGQAGSARAEAEFDWRLLSERTSEIFNDIASQGVQVTIT